MAYIAALALAALAGAFFVVYRQQEQIKDLTARLVSRNEAEYRASIAPKAPVEPEPEYKPRMSFYDTMPEEVEREQ